MRRSQSPQRRLRACVPCSKARARCHFQPTHVERHLCDRCERLGIECEVKATAVLRRPRRIRGWDSKEGSMAYELPAMSHDADEPALAQRLAAMSMPVPRPARSASRPSETRTADVLPSTSKEGEAKAKSPAAAAAAAAAAVPDGDGACGLSWAQADRVLDIFRDDFMPNFPFVVVDRAISARQLYEERPTVFRSIMMVAARLPVRRLDKMKGEFLGYIGQRLLVEDGRTLDMLQGLLICISWASLRNLCDEQVTTLTYLALGCAHTLGITKIPAPPLRRLGGRGDAPEDIRKSSKLEQVKQKMHSLEEQRAFLGCFCVLAVNSVHFGHKNPLSGGGYVDICCETLVEAMEHSTDFFLERTIRLAQTGEGMSEAYGAPNDGGQRGAKSYLDYLETSSGRFRRELDRIMESVGDEQQLYHRGHPPTTLSARRNLEVRRGYLTLHYQYLNVRLHEPATHLRAAIRGQTSGGNDDDAIGSSELRSLRLRNCLAAVTAYLDTLLAQPPESTLTQPLSFEAQATSVIVVATRLVLDEADAPDWDVEKVRRTFDLPGTVGRLAEMLDAAEAARRRGIGEFAAEMGLGEDVDGGEDDGGRAAAMAREMRGIQDWFEAKLRRGGKRDEEVQMDGDPEGHDARRRDGHGIPEEWIPRGTYVNTAEQDNAILGSGWMAGLLGNTAWNFDDMNV